MERLLVNTENEKLLTNIFYIFLIAVVLSFSFFITSISKEKNQAIVCYQNKKVVFSEEVEGMFNLIEKDGFFSYYKNGRTVSMKGNCEISEKF